MQDIFILLVGVSASFLLKSGVEASLAVALVAASAAALDVADFMTFKCCSHCNEVKLSSRRLVESELASSCLLLLLLSFLITF